MAATGAMGVADHPARRIVSLATTASSVSLLLTVCIGSCGSEAASTSDADAGLSDASTEHETVRNGESGASLESGAGVDDTGTTHPQGEAGTDAPPSNIADSALGDAPRESRPPPMADAKLDNGNVAPSDGGAANAQDGSVEACGATCAPSAGADVLTQHNDVLRTGANLGETALNAANVAGLHELYRVLVDGEIYAQPLYAHGVTVAGTARNVVYVATMEDSVYAFDADTGGAPLWQRKLGTPGFSSRNVGGNNGILSTPVIDRSTNTMYVSVRDCQPTLPPLLLTCTHHLVALDLGDGSTLRTVPIQGQIANEAGVVTFNPNQQWNRAGLLLSNGRIYIAFTAGPNADQHEEDFIFHGWVFGYAADHFDLPPSVYCSTPRGWGGGIWQSGGGLAADGDNLYFTTGNSVIAQTVEPPSFFPVAPLDGEDSLVKLANPAGSRPAVTTYYDNRPYLPDGTVFQYMESHDVDLSAGGPLLIPDTRQLVTGGKSGIVYNVDRDTMQPTQAPLSAFTNPPLASGQSLYIYDYGGNPQIHVGPAFWKPASAAGAYGLVYFWPAGDKLKGLRYDYATKMLSPMLEANNPVTPEGGVLSLSANGDSAGTGILWASSTANASVTGHLFAFDAETLALLWGIDIPHYAKWVPPTVADGKVFIANSAPGTVDVKGVIAYGL
jgi:outer membrane protein assembly factor BamB